MCQYHQAKMSRYLQTSCFILWIMYILGNIRTVWQMNTSYSSKSLWIFLVWVLDPKCADTSRLKCVVFLWVLEKAGTWRLDIVQSLCEFCQFFLFILLDPKCANTSILYIATINNHLHNMFHLIYCLFLSNILRFTLMVLHFFI